MSQSAAPDSTRWHVRLLGALVCSDGERQIERFPSRAVAGLLARLALAPGRVHAREELIELLWPGVDLAVGRNRLRQALSTLRSLLEPSGGTPFPVLQADRQGVRAVPGALACDALAFEAACRAGRWAQALALYGGELLPGFYDEWIAAERLRLTALHARAVDAAAAQAAAPAAVADALLPATPAGRWLPQYLTRLFGVAEQTMRLREQVLRHRLVTVLGPGGSGKTRLAVALAQALQSAREAGLGHDGGFAEIVFAPAVDARDARGVVDAVLRALGAARAVAVTGTDDDIAQALCDRLAGRSVLLLLDNAEQFDDSAGTLLSALAARLPQLRLLLTSRRALDLDGERLFPIAPLALPPAGAGLQAAAASPALALFVDRAQSVRPDFHLNPGNAAALVALVRLLEGMPLALELAAAQVRSVTPLEMVRRLSGPPEPGQPGALALLQRRGSRAGGDRRHASMAAMLAWSWGALDAAAQRLLQGVAMFPAGCPLDAAAACSAFAAPSESRSAETAHTAATVAELADAAWLRLQADPGGTTRLLLTEPVREFVAGTLQAPAARQVRAAQWRWWMEWAAGLGPTPSLPRVRDELVNLTAALAAGVADDRAIDTLALAQALRPAFNELPPPAPALAAIEAALSAVPGPAAALCHAQMAALVYEAGDAARAEDHAQRALALSPPGSASRARALHACASVRWRRTRRVDGLHEGLDEAQRLAQHADDAGVLGSVLALRGFIANVAARDPVRGEALHRQALAQWQRLGNLHVVHGGLYNLAACALHAGRHAEALERLQALCAATRATDDAEQLADALNLLGNTYQALRDWTGAEAAHRECVRVAWSLHALHALAYGLWNLPLALARRGQGADAARLMSFAAAFWSQRFGALIAADLRHLQRVQRLVAAVHGQPRVDLWWAEGAALPLAEAVHIASGG